jgi:hypothetical protein
MLRLVFGFDVVATFYVLKISRKIFAQNLFIKWPPDCAGNGTRSGGRAPEIDGRAEERISISISIFAFLQHSCSIMQGNIGISYLRKLWYDIL